MSAARDAVAGMMPRMVFVPDTAGEAASRIAESELAGESVAFIGGGTDLEIGNPPERLDLVIRTEKLDRIVEHAPSDQIIAVEGGTTLARVQEVVGTHGQRLALDPPWPDRATIGGIVAANAFGPLRTRYGSVRDLIIGVSIVRADGVLAHGGGKVVKNVAGFDLPKLMVGSLGTLGMIATATFRLHPLPESSETLLLQTRNATAVRTLVAELRQSQLEVAAMVAIAEGNHYDVAVRFEGFRAGVIAQRDRLSQLHGAGRGCDVLSSEEARGVWRRHDAVREGGTLRLKIAALPAAIETVTSSVVAPLLGLLTNGRFVWYPMTGLGFITGTALDIERAAVAVESAREVLAGEGGSLTVEAAPAAIRQRVSIWGAPTGVLRLMQATKQRFDPGRRFAPGRLVGGI